MTNPVIYIIEPDQIMGSHIKEALDRKYEAVLHFKTAQTAARALDKMIPHIIVLEMALSGHNGFEYLYELHSYSDTKRTKIVVHSFIHPDEIDWHFVNRGDLGIVEYLHKPSVQIKDVLRAIDAIA